MPQKIKKQDNQSEKNDPKAPKNIQKPKLNINLQMKKLKETEDKLLRSLAEIENQRRRFEKED